MANTLIVADSPVKMVTESSTAIGPESDAAATVTLTVAEAVRLAMLVTQ